MFQPVSLIKDNEMAADRLYADNGQHYMIALPYHFRAAATLTCLIVG